MSLRIDYVDEPLGAQGNAEISATSIQPFVDAQSLATLTAKNERWATLEPEGWPLDGTRKLIGNASSELGWWSKHMSDVDGIFNGQIDNVPVITIRFPITYTATALTFCFWPSLDEWCSEMEVLWFRGEEIIDQILVHPNSANWELVHLVENFDKIEISILATNKPNRYAKLQYLQIGRTVSYFSDEIVSVQLLNETDPSLCSLTVDTMTVEIRNRRGDPILPQKDQRFSLFRNDVQIASHYITKYERQARNNYKFSCQSAIGRLEDIFLGGMYNKYSLEQLLQEVLSPFPFRIDPVFYDKTITGYLPVCTRREALQQIAFAVGAVVSTQGDGVIRLQPLAQNATGKFENGDIFTGAKLDREQKVSEVRLVYHNYTQTWDEDTLLNDELIDGEDVLFTFSDPHYNYVADGGSVVSYGINWAKISASGPVTLYANKYQHTEVLLTKKNPLASAAEKGNVLSVEKATLVNAENADEILNRLYAFSELNNVLNQDAAISSQHSGQIVSSPAPWGPHIEGYITSMESAFTTNGRTASIQIRGREVEE